MYLLELKDEKKKKNQNKKKGSFGTPKLLRATQLQKQTSFYAEEMMTQQNRKSREQSQES